MRFKSEAFRAWLKYGRRMAARRLATTMLSVLLASFVGAGMATAETKVLAKAGSWEAFGGTAMDRSVKRPRVICGLKLAEADRYLSLNAYQGDFEDDLIVGYWPRGQVDRASLALFVDKHELIRGSGDLIAFTSGGTGALIAFDVERRAKLLAQLGDGRQIEARAGSRVGWHASLFGAATAIGAFRACTRDWQ